MINLIIADADGSLNGFTGIIRSAFGLAKKQVTKDLGEFDGDVIVLNNADETMRKTGVGGFTESFRYIYIYIDPGSPHLLESEIYYTICHELNHMKRYQKYNADGIMLNAVIMEGLATVYEESLSRAGNYANQKSFFAQQIAKRYKTDEEKRILKIIKPHLSDLQYNKPKWLLYGDKSEGIPRWSGYQAGYSLVKNYMLKTGKTMYDIILLPPEDFLVENIK
jgi:uncharacterized protein YjaZ